MEWTAFDEELIGLTEWSVFFKQNVWDVFLINMGHFFFERLWF